MSVSKILFNGVGIDLTGDTVSSAADIVSGKTAHLNNGDVVAGTAVVGGKEVVFNHEYGSVKKTSLTDSGVSITIPKTGKYNLYWLGFRQSNSGTNSSRLYKGSSAIGTDITAFTDTYVQDCSLTNQSLNQGDVIHIYARSRSTSYAMIVGHLIAEEV